MIYLFSKTKFVCTSYLRSQQEPMFLWTNDNMEQEVKTLSRMRLCDGGIMGEQCEPGQVVFLAQVPTTRTNFFVFLISVLLS